MAAQGGTSVSNERELVEQQISAAFSKNWAKLAACYAKDVRYVDPGGELTGVDAVLAHVKEVFDPFPRMSFDVEAIYEGDGWAIAEGVVSGKNTGPLVMPDGSTLPATGRDVEVRTVVVFELRDGAITAERNYWDNMAIYAQLGLLPG